MIETRGLVALVEATDAMLKAANVELAGPMTTRTIETVCDTLDSRQPDVMNHWETPNRVQTVSPKVTSGTLTLPAYSASAITFSRQ